MLPGALPAVPGYSFWAFWEPAFPVGGDLYDFHTLPTGEVLIVLADVSGKGLPAALWMASLAGMIPLAVQQTGTNLQSFVELLNTTLCKWPRADKFASCIAVLLDPSTHRVQVVNAGPQTGLLRHRHGTIEDLCTNERTGLPLGVLDGFLFAANAFDLMPGEAVVIASDGITGAVNAGNEVYGAPRLNDVIACTEPEAGELGEAKLENVKAFIGSHQVRDDVAMVCFARNRIMP